MSCNCNSGAPVCGCNPCAETPVKTQYLGEVPIDALDSLPEFLLGERDIEDPVSGDIKRTLSRIPSGRLFPNANMDNIIGIDANNVAIVVPENQVRAVYIKNEGSVHTMQYADEAHRATMLALGEMANVMLVQNAGFVNIPAGHDYIVGAEYWAGDNGEPVTNKAVGTHLFTPISRTKLAVNIYYKD